jgi:hypothetical protein
VENEFLVTKLNASSLGVIAPKDIENSKPSTLKRTQIPLSPSFEKGRIFSVGIQPFLQKRRREDFWVERDGNHVANF